MSTFEELSKSRIKIEPKEIVITSTPNFRKESYMERILENHGYTKEQLEEYYNEFIGQEIS